MTFRDHTARLFAYGHQSADALPVADLAALAHMYCTEHDSARNVVDEIVPHLDPEVALPEILAHFYDEQSQLDLTDIERVMSHRDAQRQVWHVLLEAANAAMRAAIDKRFAELRMLEPPYSVRRDGAADRAKVVRS